MKSILCSLFIVFNMFCYGQIFEQDELIVEVGMGFPNLSYLKSSIGDPTHFSGFGIEDQYEHKSRGQFIASSEFLMTKTIGFEVGLHYGNYYDYSTRTLQTSTQSGTTTETYYYKQNTNRLRLYLGFNFHVIRSERLDSYVGVKVGFKKTFIDFESNDPNSSTPTEFEIPFAFRASYGLRYFINQNWGLHTELGLGGPLITFGLTYKIID